jgi:hypothetical protein
MRGKLRGCTEACGSMVVAGITVTYNENMRSETEIFGELEQLCRSAGYIHLYAYLVFRNTFVRFAEGIKGEDFYESFGRDHLIRTELTTLLGLVIKQKIDFSVPTGDRIVELGTRTQTLLEELHTSLAGPMRPAPETATVDDFKKIDFTRGAVLREATF